MMTDMVKIFKEGGFVMWPILVLSIIGFAILIDNAIGVLRGNRTFRGMGIVNTIITAEPMLGILGTVLGIIKTFSAFRGDGASSPLAATAGIGEALITTAAGLIVALALLFPYNWLAAHAKPQDE